VDASAGGLACGAAVSALAREGHRNATASAWQGVQGVRAGSLQTPSQTIQAGSQQRHGPCQLGRGSGCLGVSLLAVQRAPTHPIEIRPHALTLSHLVSAHLRILVRHAVVGPGAGAADGKELRQTGKHEHHAHA